MVIVDRQQAKKAFLNGCSIVIYGATSEVEFEIETRPENKKETEIRRFNKIVKIYRDNYCIPCFAINGIRLIAD